MVEAGTNVFGDDAGLENYCSVCVDLSDVFGDSVVKLLEFGSLCYSRNQEEWISDLISDPWLIEQVVCYHVLISLESLCYFLPCFHEFLIKI